MVHRRGGVGLEAQSMPIVVRMKMNFQHRSNWFFLPDQYTDAC